MSRTIVVYLVHADPVVRASYAAALDRALTPAGVLWDLVIPPVAGGFSSAYVQRAATLRSLGGGSVLTGLLQAHPPPRERDALVLATFSAGYALARAILSDARDAARVDGYAAIDSVHGGLDAQKRATGLDWLTAYAARASRDEVSCWLGHTDVPTPQTGANAFASTTQVAQAARLEVPTGGAWHVQDFDLERDPRREHMRALTTWGPEWVAGCALEVAERRGWVLRDADGLIVPAPAPALDVEPLGVRALRLAVAELDAGIAEVPPGSNSGPRVREYLAGCERDGRQVGLTAGDWCAAAASWCAFRAQRGAEQVPHRWRISVRELWADAVAVGAAVRAGPGVLPEPGDLAILARGGGDPTRGGIGHVARVELVSGDEYVTVDGNSGVSWKRNRRRLNDPALRGWIRYPRALACTTEGLREAAALRACARDTMEA
jgi:hypothetical protein